MNYGVVNVDKWLARVLPIVLIQLQQKQPQWRGWYAMNHYKEEAHNVKILEVVFPHQFKSNTLLASLPTIIRSTPNSLHNPPVSSTLACHLFGQDCFNSGRVGSSNIL